MREQRLNVQFDVTLYRDLVNSLGSKAKHRNTVEYEAYKQ